MVLGVIAGPIAGIEEHRCRRIMACERAIVSNIGPQPTRHRLSFGQHRHRGIVAVDTPAGQDMSADEIVERSQNYGAAANLVGERRKAQVHAFARIAFGLPVERLMLPVLLEHYHGQQAWTGEAARQDVEGCWYLRDALADSARELLAHGLYHFPLPWHHL